MRMTASDDAASVERGSLLPPEHAVEDTTTLAPIARTAQNMGADIDTVPFIRPSLRPASLRHARKTDDHSARVATRFFEAVSRVTQHKCRGSQRSDIPAGWRRRTPFGARGEQGRDQGGKQ